ncbi:unnamed protein product [Amaranthus hypochondriacus]
MSGVCGNCDCADKSQCVKKGSQYGASLVENDIMCYDGMVMEEGGKCDGCKCGAGCSCANCSCCSH